MNTLADLFIQSTTGVPHGAHLSYRRGSEVIGWSTVDFREKTRALADWLEERDVRPGDRVAILSENRPEWHAVDFACHLLGAVVVPIYTTLSPARMRFIVKHAGAKVVALSAKLRPVWEQLRADLPDVMAVIDLEELPGVDPKFEPRRLPAPEDLATIIYTSGTTGDPKGVMLTHANLVFNIHSTSDRLAVEPGWTAMAVLPLAHIFERSLCYSYLAKNMPIAYGDPHELIELLPLFQPHVMAVVPRILEKVHERILAQVAAMPAWKQSLVRELMEQQKAHRWLSPLADGLIYAKLRERFGGHLAYLISGGAALKASTGQFFVDAGIPIYEGYGLSETSPVIAVNPQGQAKLGTVGTAVPGCEVRLADDGELLVRGGNVMKGYWKDPLATLEALRDGWFHTGDLARIDEEGYITIVGRKKEVIVTSNGKKVSHGEIEEMLSRSQYIQNAVLIGDGRRFVSAFIVPRLPALVALARQNGWDEEALFESDDVHRFYQEEIDRCQAELSDYEKVRAFLLIKEETLQDPEFLTPTHKIRRRSLEQHYQQAIDALYTVK